MTAIKRARIRRKTHRLIATKYPTVGVFDDLASDPGDLRAAFILEALTNDRLAAQRINLLPDEEIIAGPVDSGASIVMAAFLHADEAGGDLPMAASAGGMRHVSLKPRSPKRCITMTAACGFRQAAFRTVFKSAN